MANVTSLGIGSGLDAAGIIQSLMAVEQRPLQLLKDEKTELDTQLSSFGKLQGYMATLRDKSQALTSMTLWGQTVATSSDPTAVSVSTTSGAAVGNYSISVQKLAAGQTVSSGVIAPDSLTPGTLTIQLGAYTESSTPGQPATGFTAKSGSPPLTIELGTGETSLAALRDKVNAAGAGVTASIITDATGSRLALRSTATGAESGFTLSGTGGLAGMSYDARQATPPLTRTETAQNAQATINGIAISSASNTLEGVSDGMTVKLLKTTEAPVDVGLAEDTTSVKTAIEDFVKAFNELATYIKDTTEYDEAAKKGGVLQGDRTVIGMQWQLRGVLNESTSASSAFARLSDIGLVMKADGTLETKSSQLEAGLANLPELRKLFATDGTDTASTGFMQRYKELADATLGAEGTFETRNSSLAERIKQNEKRQGQMEERLEQTEARLTAQYQALDATMAKLNGLSSYVTQQLASLSLYRY